MLRSLRAQLILLMVVVLLMTGSLSAWFASRAIEQRFDDFYSPQLVASEERRQLLESILPQILAAYYSQGVRRDDVDKLLSTVGQLSDERIVLTDARGYIIADSAYLSAEESVGQNLSGMSVPIRLDDRVVAELIVIPRITSDEVAEADAFRASINSSLLWAVIAAGTVSLLLTLALSRGLLRSIELLTSAVRSMGRGDLKQRVDITTANEIGELATAFNIMADNLARNEQLRRNIVTDVAHELRTPLSNIRGYLEALQDGIVQPTPDSIDSLHEEAMLLNHLVDDLQDLALAEAGQLKLLRQPVRVDDIIDKATQMGHHTNNGSGVNGNGIQLEICLPRTLPVIVVDAERIGQVVRNLLNNAFTHTPPGGNIKLNVVQANGQVTISVCNSGEGIAPEHQPYVFERFYRADSSRTRATGGSGLGLAIVKQLVEAHGGRVWVTSTPGQETTFSFTLPAISAPARPEQHAAADIRSSNSSAAYAKVYATPSATSPTK